MIGRFGTTAAFYLRCLRFIMSPPPRHLDGFQRTAEPLYTGGARDGAAAARCGNMDL